MVRKSIALYGTSLSPPGVHHGKIVEALRSRFDIVQVVPCGPRPDRPELQDVDPVHRAVMTDLAFRDRPGVGIDLFDLENDVFTRTYELKQRYAHEGWDVWVVIGPEFIRNGKTGESLIQKHWHKGPELWDNSYFAVLSRAGSDIDRADFPPHAMIIPALVPGSSSEIRNRVFNRKPYSELVIPEVRDHIERYGLYRGAGLPHEITMKFENLQALVIADVHNPQALELKRRLRSIEDETSPLFIIVIGGDGTMLHAVECQWRKRLPIVGINAGHVGFLLNDVGADFSPEYFEQEFAVHLSRLLRIEAVAPDGTIKEAVAFNEAALQVERTASDHAKGGLIRVEINNELRLPSLSADGMFVATAAGSTAYAYAAGARPVPLGTNVLVVQGLAAYSPPHWGENVSVGSTVVLRNADKSRWRKLVGFYDSEPLGEVVELRVRASKIAAVELLTGRGYSLPKKLEAAQNRWRENRKEKCYGNQ